MSDLFGEIRLAKGDQVEAIEENRSVCGRLNVLAGVRGQVLSASSGMVLISFGLDAWFFFYEQHWVKK